MAESQDFKNDSESQTSSMEDSTPIPKFTRQGIKKMKEQLLTYNLGKECLSITGSFKEKQQRLMDFFYPPSVSGAASDSRLTPFHHAASVEVLGPVGKINPSSGLGATPLHHAVSVEGLQLSENINPPSGSGTTQRVLSALLHSTILIRGRKYSLIWMKQIPNHKAAFKI